MSSRSEQIAADVARAGQLFLSRGVDRVEEEDGTITFDIKNVGSFTACFDDTYPGNLTVMGPDDFELEHTGNIEQVLETILLRLEEKGRNFLSVPGPISATRTISVNSAISNFSDNIASEEVDIVVNAPMEPLMAEDITFLESVLGDDAVENAEYADSWRVRIRVGLFALETGEPLISLTTGQAWGVNPELPLWLELHLPKKGYRTESMPSDFIKKVWQEGFSEFLLEKQLIKILSDYSNIMLRKEPLTMAIEETEYSPEQRDIMREYDEKKAIMISASQRDAELGFLTHLVMYLQKRITTVHEYCALCDQSFGLPPMMMRTVCTRTLCAHQFAAFGDLITSAEGIHSQAEVLELLIFMLAKAAESHRKELVLDPFPCVYGGASEKEKIFHPSSKDYGKLNTVIAQLMTFRTTKAATCGAAWTSFTASMDEAGAGLVKWVLTSNRTYLAPLKSDQRIKAFGTSFQYLLISAPPEKETEFQRLKSKHGSIFAFHGSHVGNWHSILRNGLKNASNTALMSAGDAYGAGIYMGKSSQISAGYSGIAGYQQKTEKFDKTPDPPVLQRQITGNRFLQHTESLSMMAVCEVVQAPSLRSYNWGYVAPDEDTVITRFFLVFDQASHDVQLTEAVVGEINCCMSALGVGSSR